MRRRFYIPLILLAAISAWWGLSAPNAKIKIDGPVDFAPVSDAIRAVQTDTDYIAQTVTRSATDLPAYDEVVWVENETRGFVTGVDGWIWEIDRRTNTATPFLDVPLMPAGARLAPDNPDRIYFCSSYFYGVDYPRSERVGLYQLDISTKTVTPLVLNIPRPPESGGERIVYIPESRPTISRANITPENSRPVKFCNDLDVSPDGQRIYFTEPFAYGQPSMGGGGTFKAAISLGHDGYIWQYDMTLDRVSLVAQNFIFPDGILVDRETTPPISGTDTSLLITETVNFSLLRVYINGERAGEYETLWANLPGMPDGLDRDAQGRIWTGLLKKRTDTFDWIHRNPWIKPLLLRLPYALMPVSKDTAILAFSPDARTPVYYAEHDGSVLSDIPVVVPGQDQLYLATVADEAQGLYTIPIPPELE